MYSKCTVMLAEKMYFNFLYAVVKVTQHMSLHNELSTRFCHIHAGQVYTYRKTVHCPKNALYLSIKTEPVTAGARMQRDMPGFCFNIPVPLHLLLTWQARFLWGGSDYFWDSVYTYQGDIDAVEKVENGSYRIHKFKIMLIQLGFLCYKPTSI